jgi:hypothetical protein
MIVFMVKSGNSRYFPSLLPCSLGSATARNLAVVWISGGAEPSLPAAQNYRFLALLA